MGLPVTSFIVMKSLLDATDPAQRTRRDRHRDIAFRGLRDPKPDRFTEVRGLAAAWVMPQGYSRDSNTEVSEAIRNSLDDFDLLAFVLHSPNRHPELHRKLTDDFEILDRVTGEKLLFFVAVEPSDEWLRANSGRHYLSKIRTASTSGARSLGCADSDAALSAMARAFSLDSLDDLPAIVVINPRQPDEKIALRTTALEIEPQLTRLGRCAEMMRSRRGSLSDRLSEWRLQDVLQLPRNHDAFKRLTMAFAAVAISSDTKTKSIAKPLLEDFLKTAWRSREVWGSQKRSDTLDCEPDEAAVALLLDYAFYLSQLHQIQQPSNQIPILPKGQNRIDLELEASAALASAETLLTHLNRGGGLVDWSPLAICFGKAFESEINASVVQFYRHLLEVPLPQFFKKHAPGVTAIVSGSRPVDFNSKRHGRWHPPGLGETLWVAAKGMLEVPLAMTKTEFLLLVDLWEEILSKRNAAAHPGVVDRESCQQMVGLWEKFVNAGLLGKLLQLKAELKG